MGADDNEDKLWEPEVVPDSQTSHFSNGDKPSTKDGTKRVQEDK